MGWLKERYMGAKKTVKTSRVSVFASDAAFIARDLKVRQRAGRLNSNLDNAFGIKRKNRLPF